MVVLKARPTNAVIPAKPASRRNKLTITGRPYCDSDRHISHEASLNSGRQAASIHTTRMRIAVATYIAITSAHTPSPAARSGTAATAFAITVMGGTERRRADTRRRISALGTIQV